MERRSALGSGFERKLACFNPGLGSASRLGPPPAWPLVTGLGDVAEAFDPPPNGSLADLSAGWLWSALARRMLAANWNVETTRASAGRLKDMPQEQEVPCWSDLDAIAEALTTGRGRGRE